MKSLLHTPEPLPSSVVAFRGKEVPTAAEQPAENTPQALANLKAELGYSVIEGAPDSGEKDPTLDIDYDMKSLLETDISTTAEKLTTKEDFQKLLEAYLEAFLEINIYEPTTHIDALYVQTDGTLTQTPTENGAPLYEDITVEFSNSNERILISGWQNNGTEKQTYFVWGICQRPDGKIRFSKSQLAAFKEYYEAKLGSRKNASNLFGEESGINQKLSMIDSVLSDLDTKENPEAQAKVNHWVRSTLEEDRFRTGIHTNTDATSEDIARFEAFLPVVEHIAATKREEQEREQKAFVVAEHNQ